MVGLKSNKPDAANPAMTFWLTIEDQWRPVADLDRSATPGTLHGGATISELSVRRMPPSSPLGMTRHSFSATLIAAGRQSPSGATCL